MRALAIAAAALTAFAVTATAVQAQLPRDDLAAFAAATETGDAQSAAAAAASLWTVDYAGAGLSGEEVFALKLSLVDGLIEVGAYEAVRPLLQSLIADADDISPIEQAQLYRRSAEIAVALRDWGAADAAVREALALTEGVTGQSSAALAPLLALRLEELSDRLDGDEQRRLRTRLSELRERWTGPSDETTATEEIATGGLETELTEALPPPYPPAEPAPGLADEHAGPRVGGFSDDGAPFEIVPVYYGVNREPSGSNDPNRYYGGRRGALAVGVVNVSVPTRNRAVGEIPRPSVWRGEFRPNPERHVILQDLETFDGLEELAARLRADMEASDRREAFVFIHGYNTEFRGAVERTAQLSVDLAIDGAAIAYSWPSRGGVLGYVADGGQLVAPVVNDLRNFLHYVAQESGADALHLIAHSMGNRYLLEALEEIADDAPRFTRSPPFDEIVFAAPDVDADHFALRVPELRPLARRMTLYASANDRALALSRFINGDYRRAGDANDPVVIEGVLDTIDTSAVSDDAVGHDDFASAALDDFRSVIWHSLTPGARCVLSPRADVNGAGYWALEAGDAAPCERESFDAAMTLWRQTDLAEARRIAAEMAAQADEAVDWAGVSAILEALAVDAR